jgi:hemoglobin
MVERVEAATTNGASDYERVGGAPAVSEVVNKFYERVLADARLAPIFSGVDMSALKRHQVQLISHVLGGPVVYEGRDLRTAHAGFDIGNDEFSRVVTHLVEVLQ